MLTVKVEETHAIGQDQRVEFGIQSLLNLRGSVASHSLRWRKVCLDYNLCSLGPVMTESGSVSRLKYVSLSRSERVTEPSQNYY